MPGFAAWSPSSGLGWEGDAWGWKTFRRRKLLALNGVRFSDSHRRSRCWAKLSHSPLARSRERKPCIVSPLIFASPLRFPNPRGPPGAGGLRPAPHPLGQENSQAVRPESYQIEIALSRNLDGTLRMRASEGGSCQENQMPGHRGQRV